MRPTIAVSRRIRTVSDGDKCRYLRYSLLESRSHVVVSIFQGREAWQMGAYSEISLQSRDGLYEAANQSTAVYARRMEVLTVLAAALVME